MRTSLIREEFDRVMAAKTFKSDDLSAGRAYIKAYVEFIHFVERLYGGTIQLSHGHFDEKENPSNNH